MKPFLPQNLQLLLLIILFQAFQSNSTTCSKYLVSTSQTTYNCAQWGIFQGSALAIPSPYKQFTVSFTMKPQAYCSGATSATLFAVSILPPGTAIRKEVMKMSYDGSLNEFKVTTEDINGPQDVQILTLATFMNQPLSFSMTVDLTDTSSYARSSLNMFNSFWLSSELKTMTYDPIWVFDSNTKLSVGSNTDGSSAAICMVQNLKIMYKVPARLESIHFSNIPLLLGDYRLTEGTGTTILQTYGTLGLATFSSPTPPIWDSFSGLKFDDTAGNQYIQLPTFTPTGYDASIGLSVGFNFYIKINQIPTADKTIFSFDTASAGGRLLSLSVTPNMRIKTFIRGGIGATVQMTRVITQKQWITVYAIYTFTSGGYGISKVYINGLDAGGLAWTAFPASAPGFSASDTIRIGGGFIGNLRRFQVYSPAAAPFQIQSGVDPCNPAVCSLDMGFTDPPTCLKAVCTSAGTYASYGTCEPCPPDCMTCVTPDTCATCLPGEYPSGSTCAGCPTHCASCSDIQTCQTCNPGYALLSNNLCGNCPAGTHISGQICCPTHCTSCTDPQTCQTCESGYGLLTNNLCGNCPTGTYLSGQNCISCPKHCSSCIDSITCKTCDSGYGLINNLCSLCPAGYYLSNDQTCKKFSEAVQETLKNSQLANSGVTQAANAISKGSSVSLSAMVGGKIFSQIKYLNISYSGELQIALLTWLPSFVSLGLTPDMSDSFVDRIPERHVPYVFEKYEVPSSFLVNFWESLGIVVFVSVLWLLFKGIEYFISPKENPKIASITRKARVMVQNFLLAVLYGVYGDLILFAIIEYRTFAFGWNLTALSFIISIILLITMSFTFYYQIRMLLNYHKIKKQNDPSQLEHFMKQHEGSQLFFKDFKDYSFSPQLFILFLTGRDMIFSFILATMFEYPLPQTIIITILDCLMIVYLFIKRPFESNFDFIQQLFFEFIGLIVNVSVFINAIFDAGKYETFQGRNNVGKLVIVANMIFNFVTGIFMLIIIGQNLLEFYRGYQQKRAKKLKAFDIQSRLEKSSHADASQVGLRKASDLSLLQESMTSNNFSSFQQESFDMSSFPHSQKHPGRDRNLNPYHQIQSPYPVLENQPNIVNMNNNNSHSPPSQVFNSNSNLRKESDSRSQEMHIPERIRRPRIKPNLPQ